MKYTTMIAGTILLAACSPATPPPSQQIKPRGEVISRVVGRDETIVIRAAASGPTYSLETNTGVVIIGEMTIEQMANSNPELFRKIKTTEASADWAGLE